MDTRQLEALHDLSAELVREALAVARALPHEARDAQLAEAAVSHARYADFDDVAAVLDEVHSPFWRAWACARLAATDSPATGARARARLLQEAEMLAQSDALPAGGEHHLDEIVGALAKIDALALARRVCTRFPQGWEALVLALLELDRVDDARAAALQAGSAALLGWVAEALAEGRRADDACALLDAIGDRYTREQVRLEVLAELEDTPLDRVGDVALRAIRCELSAFHALCDYAAQCVRADERETAHAFAAVAARLAQDMEPADRARAIERVVQLYSWLRDFAAARDAARVLSDAAQRREMIERTFWRLVPDDESEPIDTRALSALAQTDEERDIAAVVIAVGKLHRRDLAGAKRWLARVRSPETHSGAYQALGSALLDVGDVAGARRAFARVRPEHRDSESYRNYAEDLLRVGDHAGAAAALEELDGGDWAVWSLAGFAAEYGQARQVRDWARAYLSPALRVQALLGAAARAHDLPPDHPNQLLFRT